MIVSCPICKSDKSIKNGNHHGKQRYKCKEYSCQYTQEQPRGKSPEIKYLTITLYVSGLSFRVIASMVKVSPKAVFDWVETFGIAAYEKPKL